MLEVKRIFGVTFAPMKILVTASFALLLLAGTSRAMVPGMSEVGRHFRSLPKIGTQSQDNEFKGDVVPQNGPMLAPGMPWKTMLNGPMLAPGMPWKTMLNGPMLAPGMPWKTMLNGPMLAPGMPWKTMLNGPMLAPGMPWKTMLNGPMLAPGMPWKTMQNGSLS